MIRAAGRFLHRFIIGAALLLATGLLLTALHPESVAPPEDLPDYDYLPRARQLARAGKYDECIQLCSDIVSQDLDNSEQAIRLLAQCEEKRSSLWRQSRLAVTGFITGSSSTTEEAAGAVISDLTLYGDLRDLGIQGWQWARGEEADPFIAAFSAIGIVTEFTDWLDWMPSVLKTFKRTGVLTQRMSRTLLRAARDLCGSSAARKSAKGLFTDLSTLIRKTNVRRAKTVLKGVDTAAELKILSRAARRSPEQLHLACHSVGAQRLAAALKSAPSQRTLRIAARKGPAGLRTLRNIGKSRSARHLKWFARIGKVFYSRHASELVRRIVERSPEMRKWLTILAGILAISGVWMMMPRFGMFKRGAKRSDDAVSAPSNDDADVPTSSENSASPSAEDRR